ncbi:MAG: TlpA family protein disulfide reductase [Phaeodactylibacter sp.]|nr:TlpA family protein disulfide reductase [Phaeodactylibacter sp.]MCB9275933.1 TlpA family protein disulfide reductase [Lewinellaceae bacterium]
MYRQFRKYFSPLAIALLAAAGYSGCLVVDNPYSGLPPGPWRGVLELDPRPVTSNPQAKPLPGNESLAFEEVTEGELPFNFEVRYENGQDFYIELINGKERIRVDDITIGRDRSTAKDTVVIRFPAYDAYIRAIFEENIMEGEWVGASYQQNIPFVARQGQAHRFTTLRKTPAMDISGRWEATLGISGRQPFKAIAEFRQDGNHLEGTFQDETGTYGLLEGSVQANKFYLSRFDGADAFLVEGKIQDDGSLIGSFRSGRTEKLLWEARRNTEFQLPLPDKLTTIRPEYEGRKFIAGPGEKPLFTPDSPQYNNKAVIVQAMGAWSPRSRAETEFLSDYLKQHPGGEIEVLALAFERHENADKAKKAVQAFIKEMAPPYEVRYAGIADEATARHVFPMIDSLRVYPTLFFIGRDGQLKRVYTGFAGPESSSFDAFRQEFDSYINQLLNEQQ